MSKVLAGGEKRGWRENDLRAIMSMMGPSDLSDLEDEVKVIQQNVRAWILRCNYKSLRKAARTLQVIRTFFGNVIFFIVIFLIFFILRRMGKNKA